MSSRSPSASGLLPMPGSPPSSWAIYGSRLHSLVKHPNTRVVVAFWLLGAHSNPIICHVNLVRHAAELTVCLVFARHRPDQQCALRNHPLRCPGPRRLAAERRRPPRRCRSLILHEAHRSILYSSRAIPDTSPHLHRAIRWRHVDDCAYTSIQVGAGQDGRRCLG